MALNDCQHPMSLTERAVFISRAKNYSYIFGQCIRMDTAKRWHCLLYKIQNFQFFNPYLERRRWLLCEVSRVRDIFQWITIEIVSRLLPRQEKTRSVPHACPENDENAVYFSHFPSLCHAQSLIRSLCWSYISFHSQSANSYKLLGFLYRWHV